MIDELGKDNAPKKQQLVLERILYVNYNPYRVTQMRITHNDYWDIVEGSYEADAVKDLSILVENGWSIISVTKAFFTCKDGDDNKTYGVETAVLEKQN